MEAEAAGSIMLHCGTAEPREYDELIAIFREANERLMLESDLSPSNPRVASIVKRLGDRLRSSYIPEQVQAVLGNEYVRTNINGLREKLSEAEFLAELQDSRELAQSGPAILDSLGRLPYWPVYLALVGKELDMLRRLKWRQGGGTDSRIVFVGSGPLPLTPILMNRFGGCEVVCLERNPDAYEASRALLEQGGLSRSIHVELADGAEFDYGGCDTIFLASLVNNKPAVLKRIAGTSRNPMTAVRTAEGMRQVMYEAIDESRLNGLGWQVLARTSPQENLVINSTLFLERVRG